MNFSPGILLEGFARVGEDFPPPGRVHQVRIFQVIFFSQNETLPSFRQTGLTVFERVGKMNYLFCPCNTKGIFGVF
jgi:hypothetical protein